jgi:hypothetical protein
MVSKAKVRRTYALFVLGLVKQLGRRWKEGRLHGKERRGVATANAANPLSPPYNPDGR